MNTPVLFAQEGTPPPPAEADKPAPDGGWNIMTFLPIIAVVFIGYFLLFRPAQRQEAERKKLLSNLKKGDDVLVHPGIYGQVVSVSETEDEIVIKVDEGTRLKMVKGAVIRNISGEKALKEQQEKK